MVWKSFIFHRACLYFPSEISKDFMVSFAGITYFCLEYHNCRGTINVKTITKKKYVPILMNNTQLTDKKQFNRLPWLHIYQMIYVLISTSKSSLRSAADRKVLVNFADLFDPQDQRDQGRARCIKDCRDRVSVVWSEIWDNSMSTFLYGMKKLYGDENWRWILPCFKKQLLFFSFFITRTHFNLQRS